MKTRIMNGWRIVWALILFMALQQTGFAQQLTTTCSSQQLYGSSCSFTFPTGYTLTVSPSTPPLDPSNPPTSNGGNTTFTYKWDVTPRSYTVKLLGEPDGGAGGPGSVLDSYSLTVYQAVGPVTLNGPSMVCQNVASSSFTASAASAGSYDWSINPQSAGTITPNGASATVTWNTTNATSATIQVTAYGTIGDFTQSTIPVTRTAMANFTPTLNVPQSPVCEGTGFSIGVNNSQGAATYAWYESDNQTVIGTSQTLNNVVPQYNSFYRVRVTPSTSIQCLNSYGYVDLQTTSLIFTVRPKANGVSFTSPITQRCQTDASPTVFTASSNSSIDSYTWTVTSGADQDTNPSNGNSRTVNWNTSFTNQATITLTGHGCGGSTNSTTRTVNVFKTPTKYSLTGTTALCANAVTNIDLSGSEAGVTYSLVGTGTKVNPTRWSVGPGTYLVAASNGVCPVVNTDPKTITSIALSSWNPTLSHPTTACETTTNFRISVANMPGAAEYYQWYREDNGTSVGSGSFYDIVAPIGSFYRLKVKPSSALCLNDYSEKTLTTNYTITPAASGVTISGGISERCQTGAATTTFTASSANNSATTYTWALTPGAGTISSSGVVTWDNAFPGTAAYVTLTGTGCLNSTDDDSKKVDLYKLPTQYSLNGPAAVCSSPGSGGVVDLSGSEASVSYTLNALSGTGTLVPGFTTRWAITPGSYSVTARVAARPNVCPPVETAQKVIGVDPPATLGYTGTTTICDTQNLQLNAVNGVPSTLTWIVGGGGGTYVGTGTFNALVAAGTTSIILRGTESKCGTVTETTIPIVVNRSLDNVTITTTGLSSRCNVAASDQLSFQTTGVRSSYRWVVDPPTAGTVDPTDKMQWTAGFVGTAAIRVAGTGCNGEKVSTPLIVDVYPTPAHKSLTSANATVCPQATTSISLNNLGTNETYELFQVTTSGGVESSSLVGTPGTVATFSVGKGLYYVRSTAPNCPVDISERITIDERTPGATFTTNTGNLVNDEYGRTTLSACAGAAIILTAAGGHEYVWSQVGETTACNCGPNCPQYFPLGQSQWDNTCLRTILMPDKTSSNGSTWVVFNNGAFKNILIRYKDDACNIPLEKTIRISPISDVQITSISPPDSWRMQDEGTTSFTATYKGVLYEKNWTMDLAGTAGSITPAGVLTWNPDWHSELTGTTLPVTINLNYRSCSGWHVATKDMLVYPLLSNDENRVRSLVAQRPGLEYGDLLSSMGDPDGVSVTTAYYDGLGRNVQNVQHFGSTNGKDLVTLKLYDEFGREAIKNLPFASNNTFNYRQSADLELEDFYLSPPDKVKGDTRPFTETVFEPTPLNRVSEQKGPGADFFVAGKGTVKKEYLTNGEEDVLLFTLDETSGLVALAATNPGRFYLPKSLSANKTTDENGNVSIEFADKEGRVVCKKVQYGEQGVAPNITRLFASTYYLYDKFGNLMVVLPPEAVKKLGGE